MLAAALLTLGLLGATGIGIMLYAVLTAPEGHEDQRGFHRGAATPRAPVATARRVPVMRARPRRRRPSKLAA